MFLSAIFLAIETRKIMVIWLFLRSHIFWTTSPESLVCFSSTILVHPVHFIILCVGRKLQRQSLFRTHVHFFLKKTSSTWLLRLHLWWLSLSDVTWKLNDCRCQNTVNPLYVWIRRLDGLFFFSSLSFSVSLFVFLSTDCTHVTTCSPSAVVLRLVPTGRLREKTGRHRHDSFHCNNNITLCAAARDLFSTWLTHHNR